MPELTVNELARAFKAAIDRQDAAALTRLAKSYKALYERMQGKLDSYLLALGNLENPTKGQVMRLTQYRNLIDALETELSKYAAYVEVEIRNNADSAVEMAIRQTRSYLAAAGYSMPATLPKNAIISMLGFLQEDSPLWKRLSLLGPENARKVADSLLEAVAFGYNPAKTAKMFENLMGGGLTDAMRMSRTAQAYASREASRAMYIANEDVVSGWVWYSSLDTDTCMACAAEHGTFHENSETMAGHYNCRCVDIPVVKGYDDKIQTGEDWFKGLSEKEQRDMMGKQTFDVWQAGGFEFKDFISHKHDEVYGEMLTKTPLWNLLGAEPPYRIN